MTVFTQPAINFLDDFSMMALQLLRESYLVFPDATDMEVRPLQPRKASLDISVTLAGMLMEVKPLQPEKAHQPILSSPFPNEMDFSVEHPSKAISLIHRRELGSVTEVTGNAGPGAGIRRGPLTRGISAGPPEPPGLSQKAL